MSRLQCSRRVAYLCEVARLYWRWRGIVPDTDARQQGNKRWRTRNWSRAPERTFQPKTFCRWPTVELVIGCKTAPPGRSTCTRARHSPSARGLPQPPNTDATVLCHDVLNRQNRGGGSDLKLVEPQESELCEPLGARNVRSKATPSHGDEDAERRVT